MTLRVVCLAEEEFADAFSWYEAQDFELGQGFVGEVESVFKRIVTYPEAAEVVEKVARRTFLRRFPYAVWYQIEIEEIVVYAIAHQHREPFYWLDRLT